MKLKAIILLTSLTLLFACKKESDVVYYNQYDVSAKIVTNDTVIYYSSRLNPLLNVVKGDSVTHFFDRVYSGESVGVTVSTFDTINKHVDVYYYIKNNLKAVQSFEYKKDSSALSDFKLP